MFDFSHSERTLVHVLRQRVEDSPCKPWIITDEQILTYEELDRLSSRLAGGMAAAGIVPGERLLVMLADGVELIATWIASAKLGVVDVPVNTAYRGDIL